MDLVLIPAYEPDEALVALSKRLLAEKFEVLVVNDGSNENFDPIFQAVEEAGCHVVRLEKNSGKGAALKAGMRHIRDHMPQCEHFITCDADGQHRVEDVIRIQNLLHKGEHFVLSVRRPAESKIPLRSKVGNDLSRFVYALLADRFLSDNQSGLRGFARHHLDWLIAVERDKYDYEMNVLYYASKKNIRIATLTIDAIYIDGNTSSHFNPIADTIRIYRSLFWLARGTFIGFLVAELAILLVTLTLGHHLYLLTLPGAGALYYAVTTLLNKYICFKDKGLRNYVTVLIYTIIEYFLYTLACALLILAFPTIPLIVAFNLVVLAGLPLRYWLHKFIFIASKTSEE